MRDIILDRVETSGYWYHEPTPKLKKKIRSDVTFILDTFTFDPKLTPIGDAIDIAELAVDFSGKYNKYFHLDETVGGKIRTVRINRDGAEFLF